VPAARKPAEPADDEAPPAIPDDLSEFDDSDSEDEGRQPPPELSASGIALPKAMATVEVTNDVIRSHSARVAVGYAETQGTRRTMEDRMSVVGAFIDDTVDYFGLFDGHGGRDVADYVSEHLHARLYEKLRNAEAGTGGVDSLTDEAVLSSLATSFVELQTDIEESDPPMMGGSVAVVALMIGEQLYVANCGDARAVLGRASGSVARLSKDHKPHDPEEKKRIEDEGGFVTQHTTSTGIVLSRVCGAIAVSRALGDVGLQPFLIADPHTTQQHLASPPGASGANDPGTVLILACDGLWDVLSDEEAVEIAAQHGDPERAATKLRNKAFSLGSTDNISVMVVQLPAFNPAPPESL
jgi:protein phosphatase 1L